MAQLTVPRRSWHPCWAAVGVFAPLPILLTLPNIGLGLAISALTILIWTSVAISSIAGAERSIVMALFLGGSVAAALSSILLLSPVWWSFGGILGWTMMFTGLGIWLGRIGHYPRGVTSNRIVPLILLTVVLAETLLWIGLPIVNFSILALLIVGCGSICVCIAIGLIAYALGASSSGRSFFYSSFILLVLHLAVTFVADDLGVPLGFP